MAHQKPWNKYEVALLIECYISATVKGKVLEDELTGLSIALRQMAINSGEEIDDVYRNMNGMHWQYGFIKVAFEGSDYSRRPTQLFSEMVALYKSDRAEFDRILDEAHRLSRKEEKNTMTLEETQQAFIKWLEEKDSAKYAPSDCIECLCRVSKYALSHNASKVDFFAITDYRIFNKIRVALSGNKIFRFTHPRDFRSFEKIGKLYSDFLREFYATESQNNPGVQAIPVTENPSLPVSEEPTIIQVSQSDNDSNAENVSSEAVQTEKEGREEVLSRYTAWLINDRGLSQHTGTSYACNMRSADSYALSKGIISRSIFDTEDAELLATVKGILENEEFSAYNTEQHNRYSAALQSFLMFKLGVQAEVRGRRRRMKIKRVELDLEVECPEELQSLITKKFPYGIRVDSSIDILKLKGFAEMLGLELPDDELLKRQIQVGGIQFEGKFFFVPNEVFEEIEAKISAIFEDGVEVIYYDEFYDINFVWMEDNHIVSSDFMRELLRSRTEGLYLSRNFIMQSDTRVNEADALEGEIKRVWGDSVLHTYDELYELLPYIPNDKIKHNLSYSNAFVWSSFETFVWTEKLVISDEEKQAILDFVNEKCESVGYASLSDVPLGNIVEENYEVSITAILDAIYKTILIDHFSINGKILTKNNDGIDALTLTRAYCSGKEECTFSELYDYVVSLIGTSNRQIALRAGYDEMVRVERDLFVADRRVNFNINEIDDLLEQFIGDEFTSVRSIATFAMFPSCGFSWNHYILETYCYKYSNKFRLEVINFNDKNAGIIVKRDSNFSYNEMLAIAAAKSGIELTTENVGRFLFDNGYAAKAKMNSMDYITERAKSIREENR